MNMVCEDCKKEKEDVSTVFDPYAEDVYNTEVVLCVVCDDCFNKNWVTLYNEMCNEI